MKLADNEETVKYFDDKRIVKLSVLKMHRAIETREELPAGKYVIVPATLKDWRNRKILAFSLL
jgi:hypothetical protein